MTSTTRRVIAIANQKGGVGKTTTAINLSAALVSTGMKVLILDLDPQGNASTGLGILASKRQATTYDLMFENATLSEITLPTAVEGLFVAPATVDLSSTDIELGVAEGRTHRLSRALASAAAQSYDVILIDCPPSLGLLTVNALIASTGVLIPLQAEFFALEGLSQLMVTIRSVREAANPGLRIDGVLLTMYDQRNNLSQQVENEARAILGDLVLATKIPRNVRVSEAPSHALPVISYDPRSKGSEAYLALAAELQNRARSERELA